MIPETEKNGPDFESESSALSLPPLPTFSEIHKLITKRLELDNTSAKTEGFSFIANPLAGWKEDKSTMQADHELESKCVKQLVKLFERAGPNRKREVQNLALAAKNRAEFLSQKSDFYPIGITVFVAFFSILTLFVPESVTWMKPVFVIASAFTIFVYGFSRFNSRSQVAELKVIANILDVVEKNL